MYRCILPRRSEERYDSSSSRPKKQLALHFDSSQEYLQHLSGSLQDNEQNKLYMDGVYSMDSVYGHVAVCQWNTRQLEKLSADKIQAKDDVTFSVLNGTKSWNGL